MSELKIKSGKFRIGNLLSKYSCGKTKNLASALFLISQLSVFAFLTSCATSGKLTSALSAASDIASAAGYGEAGAVLNAGASVSKAMEEITPQNEYYIGRAVAATILSNYRVYSAPVSEAYLNKICGTIVINSENPEPYNGYHVKILDSTEVNAFATSGGHIFITRGLLACTNSEDALAGVIAHEMAHVQLQHSLKAIKTSRWTSAGIAATSAAVSAAKKDSELAATMNDMVSDVVTNMVNNGYSKTQEFDADALALTLMANAGYNPSAMLDMLSQLKAAQGGKSGGMYKTHPSPDQRISSVNSALKKVSAPADTANYRKARFTANK
ncbi:MAG: M48 family metallopeptidase [Treponema sp.]|uniref:M48 family metallopeptidase n=1 Tax=Treponema sp. TaxID=166 RepID=UPI0025F575B5|nr:M48 family metallopeptidase [Treponema sp.]MBQ9282963.1 M48 family metallopeptidase [Treponema sp.]